MDERHTPARTGLIVALSFATLGLLVAVVILLGSPVSPSFLTTVRKSQLVATMRVSLHAAVEAEKSAVLAETDEASLANAEEARKALAAVDSAQEQLRGLVEKGAVREEVDLLGEFLRSWETLKQVDAELLPLAVQNTNLKAQRLASGPGEEAAERMETSLSSLVDAQVACDRGREVARWSFRAVAAVARVRALQAPHIAEASDERMDEIEALMKGCDRQVVEAFDRLDRLVDAPRAPAVAAARAAYADFARVNAELLRLSRENSNVRSLALSLGRKRVVTAECEEVLAALQTVVDRPTFTATR
jgi:hypothetical protein